MTNIEILECFILIFLFRDFPDTDKGHGADRPKSLSPGPFCQEPLFLSHRSCEGHKEQLVEVELIRSMVGPDTNPNPVLIHQPG